MDRVRLRWRDNGSRIDRSAFLFHHVKKQGRNSIMPAPTTPQNWFKRYYGMIILIFIVAAITLQSLTYHPSIYYDDYVDHLFSYYTNNASSYFLNTTKTFAEEDTTLQPATSPEEVNATKWNAAATNKTDQMHPLHPATEEAMNKPEPNVTLTFKKRRFDVSITYNYSYSVVLIFILGSSKLLHCLHCSAWEVEPSYHSRPGS